MKKIITSILLLCFLGVNNLTYVYAEEKLTGVQKLSLFTLDKLEEETKQTIENVEKQITDYELKGKLEDKKEEINQLIKETQEEIKQEKDKEELKEILDETTKILTLKAVSGVTPTIDITQEINFQSTTSEEDKSKAKETLIKSLDNNGYYNLYLKTNLGISQIQETLLKYDSNLRIQLLFQEGGYNYYELNTSKESILREELLENIQKGEIPEDLIGIEIVKPELLKVNNEYEEEQNNQNGNNLQTNYDSDSVKISNTKNQENTQNITQENWGYKKYNISKYQSLIKEKTTNNGKKIKVGIIDTGISYNNPEISNQISKTTPGYDFVNDDNDPTDDQGHGTHVSGIIGSENNSIGITGINPNIEIVPLKICDSSGFCPSYGIYKAIDYSIENKLDVLNMSLGSKGNPLTSMICESISQASKNGIIVVTAAGNSNTDANTFIPGGCNDVITVGAVDEDLSRAGFSNYGEKVDVAAPGVGINSTYLINSYKVMNGTSMAVPHITGIVSILKTYNQNLTLNQAKEILKNNSIEVSSVEGKNIGKFVDFEKLMNSLGVSIQETTKDEIITENSLKDTNIVSNTNNTTNTGTTIEGNTTNNTTKETPKTENNQNTDSNKNNGENSIKLPNNETSDSGNSNSNTNKNIGENNTKTGTGEDSIILPILEKSPEELGLVNISILDETIGNQLNQENNENIVGEKTNGITSEVNSNYENVNNSANNEINNTQKSEEYTSTPEEGNQIQQVQNFDLNSIFDNNIVNNNLKETSNYNDYFINNYDNYGYYDYGYYDNGYNNYENNAESYYNESQSQINQSGQEISYEDNTSDDSLSLQATYTCDINVGGTCNYSLTNANNTSTYSYSVSTSGFISYSTTSSNLTITGTKAGSVSFFIRKYNTSTKKFDSLHTVNVNIKEPVKSLTASLGNSSIQTSATTSLNITSGNGGYSVSSSNTNVASVSGSNTSWTITGKSAGDATITVKDSKTSLNLSIKVTSPTVTIKNLVLSSNSFQIDKGTYGTFSIKDGNGGYVIKTSSPNLGVYDNGVNSYKVYSTVPGTYTVQVTDSQKKSASLTISVLNILTLDKKSLTIDKGTYGNFTIIDGNGGYSVKSSSNNLVVSANGTNTYKVYSTVLGTYTVQVTDSKNKLVNLTVNITNTLILDKTSISLYVGEDGSFTITSGNGNYIVTSSNTSVITVTGSNTNWTLTGKGVGNATISVKDGGGKVVSLSVTIKDVIVDLKTTKILIDFSNYVNKSLLSMGFSTGPTITNVGDNEILDEYYKEEKSDTLDYETGLEINSTSNSFRCELGRTGKYWVRPYYATCVDNNPTIAWKCLDGYVDLYNIDGTNTCVSKDYMANRKKIKDKITLYSSIISGGGNVTQKAIDLAIEDAVKARNDCINNSNTDTYKSVCSSAYDEFINNLDKKNNKQIKDYQDLKSVYYVMVLMSNNGNWGDGYIDEYKGKTRADIESQAKIFAEKLFTYKITYDSDFKKSYDDEVTKELNENTSGSTNQSTIKDEIAKGIKEGIIEGTKDYLMSYYDAVKSLSNLSFDSIFGGVSKVWGFIKNPVNSLSSLYNSFKDTITGIYDSLLGLSGYEYAKGGSYVGTNMSLSYADPAGKVINMMGGGFFVKIIGKTDEIEKAIYTAGKYKAFDKNNYRHNLIVLKGVGKGSKLKDGYVITNPQAHHIFPQSMRDKFFSKGINIDDPKYLVWVESKSGYAFNHQKWSSEYNTLISKKFNELESKKPSLAKDEFKKQFENYAKEVSKNYNYNVNY